MEGTLTILFLCCGLVAAPTHTDDPSFTHIRSDEPAFRALIADGYRRSAAFRSLAEEIESLPGIVYIEPTVRLSQGMEGALLHAVSGSPSLPVLRILLMGHPAGDHAIGLIAHELQHVAEALRSGATSSPIAMTRFFQSVDATHTHATTSLETDAARQIAARVLRELHQSRERL